MRRDRPPTRCAVPSARAQRRRGARRGRGRRAAPGARRRPDLARRGRRPGPGRRAGGGRPPRRRHLLAQGLHPADPAVPGPVPLLHVRHRARQAAARGPRHVPVPGRGAGHRPRAARNWAARRRCSPSATGPRTAGRRPREWLDAARLRRHPRLRAGHGDPGPGGDRAAAAPQPRRAVLDGLPAAQARRAVHGHDAGDHRRRGCGASRAARTTARPTRSPRCGCGSCEDAGRSNVPFTTGVLIGIGETYEERADVPLRAPPRPARLPRRPGSHRAELPRQAGHGDARHAGRRTGGAGRGRRRRPASCSGPAARIQAPPNLVDDEYALLIGAGIDDWGGVSPLTPDHVNPERPWPQIDELAARTARGRLRRCANASPSTRSSSAAANPGSTRGCCRTSPRWPTRTPAWPARTPSSTGRPWQEPEERSSPRPGRTDLHRTIDTEGRTADRRDDFDEVYGDWEDAARARRTRHGARARRRRRAGGAAHRRRRPDPAHRRRGARPAARRRPGAGRAVPDRRRAAPRRRRRRRHLHRHPQHQLHQRLLHRLPLLRLRAAPHRRRRLHPLPRPGRRPRAAGVGGRRRSRCACRAASTPTCRAPPTSTSPAR